MTRYNSSGAKLAKLASCNREGGSIKMRRSYARDSRFPANRRRPIDHSATAAAGSWKIS